MDGTAYTVALKLRDGYEFDVDFLEDGMAGLMMDEPPPLGGGAGPNPARLLAAAVGGCLAASLRFCLAKSRVDLHALDATVEASVVRNERGRLRIGGVHVTLAPTVAPGDGDRIRRCLELFEDFCIVTESVRQGLDVDVRVEPAVAEPEPAPAGLVTADPEPGERRV